MIWVVAIAFGVPILLAGVLTITRRNRRVAYYADAGDDQDAADHLGVSVSIPDVPVP